MSVQFSVALLQMVCYEGDRKKNYGLARLMLERYSSDSEVDFIILPELFDIGFNKQDFKREGPGVLGPTSEFVEALAEEHSAYVITTGIEAADDMYYNTLVMANPEGKTIATYRKIHPFQEEKDVFKPGEGLVLVDIGRIKVGLQICYDIRFPEVSRSLALAGAELLVVPASFPDPRSAHWNILLQARAIENQLYVAATNRVGFGFDSKTYFGHAQMIDPWGMVLTRPNTEERVVKQSGDTHMIKTVREKITCYSDRQPTRYGEPKVIKA